MYHGNMMCLYPIFIYKPDFLKSTHLSKNIYVLQRSATSFILSIFSHDRLRYQVHHIMMHHLTLCTPNTYDMNGMEEIPPAICVIGRMVVCVVWYKYKIGRLDKVKFHMNEMTPDIL